jgi:hypothetical protein
MRYCKGSFVISLEKDIPLLVYVRNCKFVSHQQLFEFLQRDGVEASRSSYNWRVQRLLKRHYLESVNSIRWQGCPVYSIARDGLLELETAGLCALAFNSSTRQRREQTGVLHALELNALRLALVRQALVVEWKTEMQVTSYNMVAEEPYQKDYDAIVTILVNDHVHEFALEFERTLKSAKRYERILEELEAEYQIDSILYLTADPVLLQSLVPRLMPIRKPIAFTTARAVREQSLAAPVLAYPGQANHMTLEEFLESAALR